LATALWLWVVPSFAQAVTLPEQGIVRINADGSNAPARGNNVKVDVISYDDCINDRAYRIQYNNNPVPTQEVDLQVWAGTSDCNPREARVGATKSCVQVVRDTLPRVVSGNAVVRVQDILSVTEFRQKTAYEPATAAICETAPTGAVTLYFVFSRSGEPAGTPANKPFTVDTRGPPAPTKVEAGTGNSLLVVTWTPTTEQSDTQSYNVYCDDGGGSGNDAGTSDAGSGNDASSNDADVDAASSSSSTSSSSSSGGTTTACPSSRLPVGKIPPATLRPCGSATGPAANNAVVRDLKNNVTYGVAVAAVDNFGNPGVLSEVGCGTPKLTDDFFTLYRGSGGGAGGCQTGDANVMPALALLVLGALGVRRMTRRRA
jgi:MYXO-CTERM domain-containing protein